MDFQLTSDQVQAIMATSIPGLKDATVERHFWAVTAIHGEAMVSAMKSDQFAGQFGTDHIAIAEEFVVDCKLNAVTHEPVPENMRDTAADMFRLAQYREGRA